MEYVPAEMPTTVRGRPSTVTVSLRSVPDFRATTSGITTSPSAGRSRPLTMAHGHPASSPGRSPTTYENHDRSPALTKTLTFRMDVTDPTPGTAATARSRSPRTSEVAMCMLETPACITQTSAPAWRGY